MLVSCETKDLVIFGHSHGMSWLMLVNDVILRVPSLWDSDPWLQKKGIPCAPISFTLGVRSENSLHLAAPFGLGNVQKTKAWSPIHDPIAITLLCKEARPQGGKAKKTSWGRFLPKAPRSSEKFSSRGQKYEDGQLG